MEKDCMILGLLVNDEPVGNARGKRLNRVTVTDGIQYVK